MIPLVEVDDENFVLGIAGAHKSHGGSVHLSALLAHAAAIVDDQAHGHGDVLPLKDGDFLRNFVFINAKVVFLEIRDELALVVGDRGMKYDHIDAGFDGVTLPLIRRGRRRNDGGLLLLSPSIRSAPSRHQNKQSESKTERGEANDRERSSPSAHTHGEGEALSAHAA